MIRALLIALAALLVAAPGAHAALADRWLPIVDSSDDVHLGRAKGDEYLRFGPKAAKLYRTLAGRSYTSGCTAQEPGGEGGSGGGEGRLPRKRSRVPIAAFPGADVCFIASPLRASDDRCLFGRAPDFVPGERPQCMRMIIVLSDQGRAFADVYARTLEISTLFFDEGPPSFADVQRSTHGDVVALPSPDASPPPGKIGHFDDGHTRVIAALLADGSRKFARTDGDVYSTNVPALIRVPDFLTFL